MSCGNSIYRLIDSGERILLVGQRLRERLEDKEQEYLGLRHVSGAVCLRIKCEVFRIAILTITREHPQGVAANIQFCRMTWPVSIDVAIVRL